MPLPEFDAVNAAADLRSPKSVEQQPRDNEIVQKDEHPCMENGHFQFPLRRQSGKFPSQEKMQKTEASSHLPHTADAQKLSLRTPRPAWHPVTSPCAELHIDGRGRCCRRTEQMCNHALNVHEKRTGRKEGRVLHSSHVRAHFQTRPVRTRVPCTIDVIAVYLGTVV